MIKTKEFFANSSFLEYLALRQLSHIKGNWELLWDEESEKYESEENSYADMLNQLIDEMGQLSPLVNYHNNEDCLAEYVVSNLNWQIKKVNNRWIGADYSSVLEQGGFHDIDQKNLILACAGRIKAAIDREQYHFDKMEDSHQKILADVIAIILYHRTEG